MFRSLKKASLFLLFLSFTTLARTQEIREFMDLQTHPCMHMAYPFFETGLEYFDEDNSPDLKYKHLLTNVNYANYLEDNKGARIVCWGVILPEVRFSRKEARRDVLNQIEFINDFVDQHPDKFVVALNPTEVRHYVQTTDKTIFVHSIEGAKRLINSQKDADFWAAQGVSYITLIHLIDDCYGAAAILPEIVTKVINYRGSLRKSFGRDKARGLTEKGKNAIKWLANAGIMIDLTHMSDLTRTECLDFMEANNIPPLVTHDVFKPIQNNPRGIPPEEILRIYKNNGFVSLPISGSSLEAHHPTEEYALKIDSLKDYCSGSIDSYKFTYEMLKELIETNVGVIHNIPELTMEDLSESEKVNLCIGFQSDFNGWLNHSKPRYGENGCFEIEEGKEYEEIEIQGLAHPGLLESQWRLLEKEGVDLEPIKRSSEKFLQMWQYFLDHKGHY